MSSTRTRKTARNKLRKQLRELGESSEAIEAACAAWTRKNLALVANRDDAKSRSARARAQEAALDAAKASESTEWAEPDDKGYKPPQVDSVLVGVARATGPTAAAVKRKRTMTAAQYQRFDKGSR